MEKSLILKMLPMLNAELLSLTIESYFAKPSPFGPDVPEQPKQTGWGLTVEIRMDDRDVADGWRINCEKFAAQVVCRQRELDYHIQNTAMDEWLVTVVMKFWG